MLANLRIPPLGIYYCIIFAFFYELHFPFILYMYLCFVLAVAHIVLLIHRVFVLGYLARPFDSRFVQTMAKSCHVKCCWTPRTIPPIEMSIYDSTFMNDAK